MLTARNETALALLARELNSHESKGVAADFVAGDVADETVLRRVAERARDRFGRIDTWVNCAGVTIYGPLIDVSIDDQRRLFETNFWGVVVGSRIAVEYLRKEGGALINIGSTLSDRAVPLQGIYCASKHAVKGYTDSLRMELEHDGLPIAVTLIKPGAVDTPYSEHGKNYLPNESKNPPPAYAPEVVARAILYCAEHPVRDVFAGGGAKLISMLGHWAPRLTDKIMEKTLFRLQQSDRSDHDRHDNGLYGPGRGLQARGARAAYVAETSLYTEAALHPLLTAAITAVVGAILVSAFRRGRGGSAGPTRSMRPTRRRTNEDRW